MVSASLGVCFFCGKDKDIIVYKPPKGGGEAPRRVLANYEPCTECAEKQAQGVTLIEVTTQDTGSIPIQRGAWPTGRWCVIRKEAAERLFNGLDKPMVLLDEPLYAELIKRKG